MRFTIESACGCRTGKIRKNNEDNFYFDGKCLGVENNGLKNPVTADSTPNTDLCIAVFDGMGGESFDECASFTFNEIFVAGDLVTQGVQLLVTFGGNTGVVSDPQGNIIYGLGLEPKSKVVNIHISILLNIRCIIITYIIILNSETINANL